MNWNSLFCLDIIISIINNKCTGQICVITKMVKALFYVFRENIGHWLIKFSLLPTKIISKWRSILTCCSIKVRDIFSYYFHLNKMFHSFFCWKLIQISFFVVVYLYYCINIFFQSRRKVIGKIVQVIEKKGLSFS